MAVLPIGIGSAAGAGGYQIERSLRFNSADSAYLNRTPASAGNRTTWTWSGWVKRAALGTSQYILQARVSDNANDTDKVTFRFTTNNTLILQSQVTTFRETTAVYRDTSAWYHVVLTADTSNATANNRFRIYVNGVEQVFSTTNNPTSGLTTAVNSANAHWIGSEQGVASYLSAYITETYLIDGQALTPSSFGETDSNTGVWKPKAYSGTYGTNGFYLKFADNSGTTSTTLGKDSSGNGNNWTPNNFSVTAGAGNDSLVDTPTSYGTDTGAGGEVRGNYCTWNPLSSNAIPTLTNGNLDTPSNQNNKAANGIIGVSSGKWYWEITVNNNSQPCPYLGVTSRSQENDPDSAPTLAANTGRSVVRLASPYVYKNYTSTGGIATGATSTGNFGTVGVALNFDTGEIKYYFNNTLLHTDSTIPTSGVTLFPYYGLTNSGGAGWNSSSVNFGQRPFAYTAPSGFKALCTQNLPTPTIGATSTTQANDYFDVSIWTGNNASRNITNSGSMQPDFVWIKDRSRASSNDLVDAVRGVNKALISDSTAAEYTGSFVSSFNSDGFSLPANGLGDNFYTNISGDAFVGWQWKANGSGSTNTSGTITSTVSANTTSGFSIVTYTGTGANATVGHGLGVAPSMIIAKRRNGIADWMVAHSGVNGGTNPFNYYMLLNTTAAQTADSTAWNNTAPTSTVFSLGSGGNVNSNGATNVAYCFAPVAGYSAFGSYTGNGSADGVFVYTGFRPKWVMLKSATQAYKWYMLDAARNTYNVMNGRLFANNSNAEVTTADILDFTSNGFKIRTSDAEVNGSGQTIIYACFAESPFKYSLAR